MCEVLRKPQQELQQGKPLSDSEIVKLSREIKGKLINLIYYSIVTIIVAVEISDIQRTVCANLITYRTIIKGMSSILLAHNSQNAGQM